MKKEMIHSLLQRRRKEICELSNMEDFEANVEVPEEKFCAS
jgi:hypothetical protein